MSLNYLGIAGSTTKKKTRLDTNVLKKENNMLWNRVSYIWVEILLFRSLNNFDKV